MAESEFADHQISLTAAVTLVDRRDVEQGEVLAGEAGLGAVLVDGRRADGERRLAGAGPASRPSRSPRSSPDGDGLDDRA